MENTREKLLVRGVNWLGDAVMSTPALIRLREAKPNSEIVLLTPEKLAGLWPGHPAIDRVLTFASGESVISVGRRLRSERFAATVVFPNSPRSALEVFLARIPARIGHARPWRNWLLTRALPVRQEEVRMHKRSSAEVQALVGGRLVPLASRKSDPRSHHMYQYLHLVECLGASDDAVAPSIAVTAEEVSAIRKKFRGARGNQINSAVIGINAGAEYGPAKRWPVNRFVEASAKVSRQRDCALWILGAPADVELAGEVAAGLATAGVAPERVQVLAGKTSLRELCAALKACDVVLTNDTGPMHVAAAVGTRVVVPFGSTSWRMTGPGLPGDNRHTFLDAHVPCSPCFRRECPIDFRCMTGISPDMAAHAVLAGLEDKRHPH